MPIHPISQGSHPEPPDEHPNDHPDKPQGPGGERDDDRDLARLLRDVAGGDEAALGRFYDRTAGLVFRFAFRILRDQHGADSVTLEVFEYVWQRAGQFDARRGNVKVWLMALARSRSLDQLRALEVRKRHEAQAARERAHHALVDEASASGGEAWIDPWERVDLRDSLNQALSSLPQEQREVLSLAYFPGLTHAEIARRVGEPLGTVKSRIRLGMNKLRESLAPLEEAR